jgi:hypothetical protein
MRRFLQFALALAVALTLAIPGSAEELTRLKFKPGASRIAVKGRVGGEQHDAYAVELPFGRQTRVAISSPKGKVNFSVCQSGNYSDAEPVKFGKRSPDGKSWEGLIPAMGTYYIFVTAYPEAEYTLLIEMK